MPVKIITVRVGLTQRGRNGFEFKIDTETPIRYGLDHNMEMMVRDSLNAEGVSGGDIDAAIEEYNKTSVDYYIANPYGDSIFASLLEPFMGVGGSGPSPFDIRLVDEQGNPFKDPCYLLYVCELDNWTFRGKQGTQEILEILPLQTVGGKYPGGKDPGTLLGKIPTTPNPSDRPKLFGLYVRDPSFAPHPDDGSFNGFKFNIHMTVKQANLHVTDIIIDPKLRNP